MKNLLTFFLTLFVTSGVWAENYWEYNDYRNEIDIEYNKYGPEDVNGTSIEWMAGNRGALVDAVEEATGSTYWIPQVGQGFGIQITGVASMTGTLRAAIVDHRKIAGWGTSLSADSLEISVTKGQLFILSGRIILDNVTHNQFGEEVDLTDPCLTLSFLYDGTSDDADFDSADPFVISDATLEVVFAENGETISIFENNGIRYMPISDDEVTVIANDYTGDIVIPSTVSDGEKTYSVTKIVDGAFSGCTGLTSITIPTSVIEGALSFYGDVEVINYSSINVQARYVYNGGKTIIGDFAFSENDKKLVRYLGDGGELVLPENFKGQEYTVDYFALQGQVFTSISIPENVDVSSCGLYLVKDNFRYRVLNGNEVAVGGNYDTEYIGNIVIPSTVTAGNTFTVTAINSFSNSSGLTSITIPSSVASIGYGAFSGCTSLTEVTCYAVQPPEVNGSFENHNAYLYVPCESRKSYDLHSEWGSFKYIECIGSEEVDLQKDEVVVEPEQTAAVFSMPTNESANSYTLTIQNNGVTFCTLTFNAQGQLSNIDFSTTKSYELKAGVSAYQFTVTGLSEATDYSYSFKALASNKSVLKEYTGSFTTKNADGTGGSSQGGEEVGGGSGQGGEGGETETKFTVTLSPNNNAYGSVMGGGEYTKGATATIAAIPASDYKFVQWNDGNTENPRQITITENCIYVATFEKISTAISEVENATTVTIVNNKILVNGEAPAFVVTISGKKIANQNLKAGVYFVNVDGETVKVVK